MTKTRGIPLGLLGVLVGALILWRMQMVSGMNGDVYWQWATGRYMLQHHALITRDPFSYTLHDRPWFDPEWGYQVLLAVLVNLVGPVAFWLMAAGVGTLTVFAVAAAARVRGAGYTWAGLLAATTGFGLFFFVRDRPQEWSYLFFAGLLALLAAARNRPRALYAIPPLLLVWANLHESFLLALLVLVLEVVWALVPVRWSRFSTDPLPRGPATLTLLGSLAATLVNPHGPSLIRYAFLDSLDSRIGNLIAEWQSPDFHILLLLVLVVGPIALTLFWLAVCTDEKVDWPLAVLTGGMLTATLHGVRFMPYWVIAWSVLASGFRPWNALDRRSPAWLVLPLAVIVGFTVLSGKSKPPGTPSAEPVAAVAYLNRHPGRVFSTYRWGDYLIARGIPVFIDGRTNFYVGTGVLGTFLRVANLTANPDPTLARYRVDYVLWQRGTALAVFLAHDPAWLTVYRSKGTVIFRRVHALP
jgi:hypothetical protein